MQSLILCLTVVVQVQKNIRVDSEKTSDLKLLTWATYSSYVGQVQVRVRVKVRVNKKKENKYMLRNSNEYFPVTGISERVYVPLTEVRSFLGPKFFCLWTTIGSLRNFRCLKSPKSNFFFLHRQYLRL